VFPAIEALELWTHQDIPDAYEEISSDYNYIHRRGLFYEFIREQKDGEILKYYESGAA